MSAELAEGMTDGTWKKAVRERGGIVEPTTYRAREDLAPVWYGIAEAQTKTDPFGRTVRTPNAVATRLAYLVV
ncbi:hypothetical protein BGM09_01335 [Streptomyces sp. CBMA29]|nr:hypothetical protein [Streptomyces sp. CBMA29]